MGLQTKLLPVETCRTMMELYSKCTLCTLTEDGWPFNDFFEFTIDAQGMHVLYLDPLLMHSHHVSLHGLCSLHVKVYILDYIFKDFFEYLIFLVYFWFGSCFQKHG